MVKFPTLLIGLSVDRVGGCAELRGSNLLQGCPQTYTMMVRSLLCPFITLVLSAGCGTDEPSHGPPEVGPDVGVVRDSGAGLLRDAGGVVDARPVDATAHGQPDARVDASLSDASGRAQPDAGPPDAQPDTGPPDAQADTGPADAQADTGPPDAQADTGPPDTGPVYPCPDLPAQCGDRERWQANLREHHMQVIDGCVFSLDAPDDAAWRTGHARADNLASRLGGAVSMGTLLGDLNRQARSSITNQSARRLRNHTWQGWIWDEGDNGVSYWYPQGITGSSDATDSGRVNNRRLQLVSWYHKTQARPTKGVRVSLADLTQFNDIDYRHLLLVVPYGDGAAVNYRPLHKSDVNTDALHAGGIVWYGDYLYVADTANGFRVFDLSAIARVSHTNDTGSFGRSGNVSHAFGYRYIVPQVARYDRSEGACAYSFSFVSLDRSSTPPALLSGEYKSTSIQGRLVHWYVDPQTHRLDARQGQVRGRAAKMGAQTKMQGAARWAGNYYISSSSQAGSFGRLYRTRAGRESSISAWVYGAEDLYYERGTGRIWTAAEFPDFRDVVSIPLLEP
jgi:hypothetical protein